MNLIFIGSPGSGKGTVSKILEQMGYQHISTGDALRKEVSLGTPLGIEIDQLISKGNFVNDDLAFRIIKENLDLSKPFILDNFPRNKAQAEMLDNLLTNSTFKVCFFNAGSQTVLNRLEHRRNCEKCGSIFNIKLKPTKKEGFCDNCNGKLVQRSDDKREFIENRLKLFNEAKKELISYYGDRLINLDANGDLSELIDKIKKLIK